jgi:MFS family permease
MTEKQNKKSIVSRVPFFYGWVIMAAGTLGLIMTSPGQTYTESIFIEQIIQDLSISRSWISTLYSFGTLVGGFSLPFWGKKIDHHGTRKMVTVISILFGVSCIYMGLVQNAWMVGVGFILVRMLGQGSLGLVSQTAINQWWSRKRGTIMGISGLLMALLGMGAFPNLVHSLISVYEWRTAYIILGIGLLAIMAPVGFLFFRDKPEDFGLEPDGIEKHEQGDSQTLQTGKPAEVNESWTLKEALHTRTFWIFGVGFSLFAMLITGLTFHLVSIFQAQNQTASLAASVFVPIALTAAGVSLLGGYLSDRIPLRYLMAIGLTLQALSLIMTLLIRGTLSALAFGVVVGATNGISRALGTVTWPSFFGRQYLGSIYGFTSAMTIIGAALGPMPFGFAYDLLGTYQPILIIGFAGLSIVLALISLTAHKPVRE